MHVVCAWIGNSIRVAEEHYLQVTEDNFARAAKTNSAPTAHLTPKQRSTEMQKTPRCFRGFLRNSQRLMRCKLCPQRDSMIRRKDSPSN